MLKSYFITGTDTDVGKTYVTAGIAAAMKKMGIDVGIMKPFAAGTVQNRGYKSQDVQLLSKAAQVNDAEELVNPYFFPIPASPFTAMQNLGLEIDIKIVLNSFKKLSTMHDVLLVEGVRGIIINNLNSSGYPTHELKRDIEELTETPVIGSIPYIKDFNLEKISQIITNKIDLKSLTL